MSSPAVAAAVRDATGVVIRDLPLTPERVWRALQRRSRRDSRCSRLADARDASLVGSKANLGVMARDLGLPVPPGFAISTEACRAYLAGGWPDGLGRRDPGRHGWRSKPPSAAVSAMPQIRCSSAFVRVRRCRCPG